jgi:hypothetical protein
MLMKTAAVPAADQRENRDPCQGAWNGTVIAELDDTAVAEGNHYFRADAMKLEHFELTSTTTVENAAWVWPENNGRRRERRGPCRLPAGRSGRRERR